VPRYVPLNRHDSRFLLQMSETRPKLADLGSPTGVSDLAREAALSISRHGHEPRHAR
jgi:hypothetical protein